MADRIRKFLPFIGLQDVGLIHFRNILQAGTLFFQQFGKGEQEFMPHVEHKVMGQPTNTKEMNELVCVFIDNLPAGWKERFRRLNVA